MCVRARACVCDRSFLFVSLLLFVFCFVCLVNPVFGSVWPTYAWLLAALIWVCWVNLACSAVGLFLLGLHGVTYFALLAVPLFCLL